MNQERRIMAEVTNQEAGANAPAGGESQQQGGAPPAPPPPKAQATPPAEKKGEGTQAGAQGGGQPAAGKEPPPAPRALKDDEDIPDDDALLQLSPKALKQRLQRHTSRELKERFGTSDVDGIKKKLERLEALEKKEEEARRAALAKEERMAEDLAKEKARADQAEARWRTERETTVVQTEDTRLKDLAGDFIKTKYWKHVARDLADHLRENYTKDQLKKLTDASLKKWFGDYVKENPEYGKEAPKVEKKLDNGARDEQRPSAKGGPNMADRTFKPGQPNSMTTAEAKAEMRKMGINY
jgi:hypothetical protein